MPHIWRYGSAVGARYQAGMPQPRDAQGRYDRKLWLYLFVAVLLALALAAHRGAI